MDRYKLKNGVGKCSVPMYSMYGLPDGYCDNLAYSERPYSPEWYNYASGEMMRQDYRYSGYVPGLACHCHGGEKKENILNLCSYCINNFGECNSNPIFGNGIGNDNVYECDKYKQNDI